MSTGIQFAAARYKCFDLVDKLFLLFTGFVLSSTVYIQVITTHLPPPGQAKSAKKIKVSWNSKLLTDDSS